MANSCLHFAAVMKGEVGVLVRAETPCSDPDPCIAVHCLDPHLGRASVVWKMVLFAKLVAPISVLNQQEQQ